MLRVDERSKHDERKQRNKDEAKDDAEFFRRDGEDEVGMPVGKNTLHSPLAWTTAEPSAADEGFDRRVDLERVAGTWIEEALKAARHVRNKLIRDEYAGDRDRDESGDPDPRKPRQKEERAPDQHKQDRLAEIRLQQERSD